MTTMQQLSSSQTSPEVPINENFETIEWASVFGKRHPVTTGLTWGYYGGRYNGSIVADGTLTLAASATNYVVMNRGTGAVTLAESSPSEWDDTGSYARLYLLTTSATAVTAEEDHRLGAGGLFQTNADAQTTLSLAQFAATTSAQLRAVLTDETGNGLAVFSISPTLETPALGTPSSLILTNATGLPVAGGGTGAASFTAYAPIFGGTTSTGAVQSGAVGTAGQVLTSNGAGALATFQTASHIGRHAVYIAAGSMSPSVTGGCAVLGGIASGGSQPDIRTYDFDATTQEYAQFSIVMPKSWNEGTLTFIAHWSHASTTTNFGVVWDLQAVAVGDDDSIATSYGTSQTSTDTGGTTNDLYSSPESSAITVAGTPAAEDMVFFRLSRVTGNGSDTMAIDARLHGITLYMTTDAGNDA